MTDTDKDAIFGKDLRVYDTKSLENIHFEPELIEDIYSRLDINKPKETYQQIVELNLIKVAYKMGHNEGTHKNQMTNNNSAPDLIEIGGVKYQKVVEEPKKPQTLKDIISEWIVIYNIRSDSVKDRITADLLERVQTRWLPDEIALDGLPGDAMYSSGWNDCLKVISNRLR